MRVAIVGCGLGGLSAAVSVQKYAPGTKLRVFERDAHPQSRPQGYTITLNQRGMNALKRLDLSTPAEQHARLPLAFHIMKCNAQTLIRMPPQDKGPGRVFPVLRETLRDLLLTQVSSVDAVISWDSKVVAYSRSAEGITLDVNGKTEGPFDILLGADGVRSAIRQQLIGDKLKSLGIVAFGGMSSSLIRDPLIASSSCFFLGKGASFFSVVTPDLTNVNFSFGFRPTQPLPAPGEEVNVDALAAEMEERLTAQPWYPAIVSVLKQELLGKRLRLRHLLDRAPLPQWPTEGVTLLGDAAHPMSPYRGQGANTAIADGVAFGLALGKSANVDWRPVLAEYEMGMRHIGNQAAEQSRGSANFFHANTRLGVWARNGMLIAGAASMRWAGYFGKK